MRTATHAGDLSHDVEGSGTPVVFLHGLTFDRRTWQPIIERLEGCVLSIAVDLPGHGQSRHLPSAFEEATARVHELIVSLGVERPLVVGHSMSGGLACLYASGHATRGVVTIDNGPDVRPFAELVRRLAPALRGPGFADVWATFENSLGLERISEPVRSLVLTTHEVNQDVVLAYWESALRSDPQELQAWIDTIMAKLDVPCLGVFGRAITEGERERFARLPDVEVEEWPEDGHFVHLVEPDRFTTRLRQFIDHCVATGGA